jgi:hypothetical protein
VKAKKTPTWLGSLVRDAQKQVNTFIYRDLVREKRVSLYVEELNISDYGTTETSDDQQPLVPQCP